MNNGTSVRRNNTTCTNKFCVSAEASKQKIPRLNDEPFIILKAAGKESDFSKTYHIGTDGTDSQNWNSRFALRSSCNAVLQKYQ